ncbi:MAG: UDP-3-O-acyl-N-acetylglucosamine deacetylase [Armatimonadetes bacterium]|nr:UDP-3-O-acyl-N-acetylglucosamine deacetylase [Armatimonadota bacterium]
MSPAGIHHRATLGQAVELPPAPGVISRRAVRVSLHPAEIGAGVVFRDSAAGVEFPAHPDYLVPSRNCTALGNAEASIAFIEHLMACLAAARISDVLVVTDGPEIPLYDGSARLLWQAVQEAGRVESTVAWPPLVVAEPVRVAEGQGWIEAEPGPELRLSYALDHPHPMIGRQEASYEAGEDFGTALAPARTFATDEEIRALYGMAPTPQIEQMCLVVYPARLSAEPGLPAPFARHKLVDLLGDLFLCGRLVQGQVRACRSGHGLNQSLARALLAQAEPPQS